MRSIVHVAKYICKSKISVPATPTSFFRKYSNACIDFRELHSEASASLSCSASALGLTGATCNPQKHGSRSHHNSLGGFVFPFHRLEYDGSMNSHHKMGSTFSACKHLFGASMAGLGQWRHVHHLSRRSQAQHSS